MQKNELGFVGSLAAALVLSAAGCGPAPGRGVTIQPDMKGGDACSAGMHQCKMSEGGGFNYQSCMNNFFVDAVACKGACDPALGCIACLPRTTLCDGDNVLLCDVTGKPGDIVTTCQAGGCIAGTCTDPCGKAAAEFSYLGCDYFPTVTTNNVLTKESNFAIAVANPGDTSVNASITRDGKPVQSVTIDPGMLKTIKLPWVLELKEPKGTTLLKGGAYKLSTDGPVTVYQFNPLEFQVRPNCNPNNPMDMSCFTYTNDASLLLPISTMTRHYIAIARATSVIQFDYGFGQPSYVPDSGFISVVGAEKAKTTVTIKFSAATMAAVDNSISGYKLGETATFTLNQGDVLQLLSTAPATCTPMGPKDTQTANGQTYTTGYCNLPTTDLTGTDITADHKIAVFSGHDCTFVPYNRWACDHLEEQMLPVESWGKDYLGIHTRRAPVTTPDYWRVVAAADATTITFDPPSVSDPVSLNKGEWVEFSSNIDFEATANNAFALVQYLVGENFYPQSAGNPGDPAMSLSVPIEQFRKSYIFLAPDSYTLNYVNISALAKNTGVMLDGMPMDSTLFKAVGKGGKYVAARLAIKAGTHTISGSEPIGIAVYGLAPYTAYMYPGGLDVKQINVQ